MDFSLGRLRLTIRVTVLSFFLLATGITACVAIGLQYYFSRDLAHTATSALFNAAADGLVEDIEQRETSNRRLLRLIARNPVLQEATGRQEQLQLFAEVLEADPLLYAMYLGAPDGSLFQLASLASPEMRQRQDARPGERWLLVTVEADASGRHRTLQFLDRELRPLRSRSEPTGYDVRQRDWYREALASQSVHLSAPYLFAQAGVPGRTLATRIADTAVVVAMDMTLQAYNRWLASQSIAPQAELYLYRPDGMLIASDEPPSIPEVQIPVPDFALSNDEQSWVRALGTLLVSNEMDWPPYDYSLQGHPQGYSVDVVRLIAEMTGLSLHFTNGLTWPELVTQFRSGDLDLLHAGMDSPETRQWARVSAPYAELPHALATRPGEAVLSGLDQLGDRSLAIPRGWSILDMVREQYPGLHIVEADSTLDALRKVLAGEAFAALDNAPVMRYIQRHHFLGELQWHQPVNLGRAEMPHQLHFLVQPDEESLLELINRAIAAIGPAQVQALEAKWLHDSLPGESQQAGVVPHPSLLTLPDDPARAGTLQSIRYRGGDWQAFAVPAGGLRFGVLMPDDTITAPLMHRVLMSVAITAGLLLLLLPLSWLLATPIVGPIRQLAEENDKVRQRRYGEVRHLPSRIREIDDLSVSMITMTEAVKEYEASQHRFLDAVIQLIAEAIDDKSPYTAGHCERVPELAIMLAEQASASMQPPFDQFQLRNEDEWREFRIAAWLHDCGKITTPEHIVDKGSKLEAIYNRLHEVRMRFEVLWRDAEINYLHTVTRAPEQAQALEEERNRRQAELLEEFHFVAECNIGGETLSDAARDRLRRIASRTWVRHFSDRVGLSPLETQRLPETPEDLPATEPLLADRPEHKVAHPRAGQLPTGYGINMTVPEWQQNLGELHNLFVSRGTLTDEDRFRIQAHMISTVKMLESLPFPEELARVPRYATTHHETLRGDGYPRALSAEALSIPERLLAIADVFEALTAADRPYKPALTLSEAVAILYNMVEEGHLDRDGFELFLRKGVYLDYARRFLTPGQVDTVPVEHYLQP